MDISGVRVKLYKLKEMKDIDFAFSVVEDLTSIIIEFKNYIDEFSEESDEELKSALKYLNEQNSLSFKCLERIKRLINSGHLFQAIDELFDFVSLTEEEIEYFNIEKEEWESKKLQKVTS